MSSLARRVALVAIFMFCAARTMAQTSYDLRSPDKGIEIRIRTAKGVRYDVLLEGNVLLQDSALSINIDDRTFGAEARVLRSEESSSNQVFEPVARPRAT